MSASEEDDEGVRARATFELEALYVLACLDVLVGFGGGGGSDVNQSEVKERMGFLCSSHSHFISDIFVPLYFKNDPGQVETLTRFHIVLQARITFCVCFSFFFKFMKHVSK